MTATVKKIGRPELFSDKFAVVDALVSINEGKPISHYLSMKLVKLGYLEIEPMKTGTRGRPRFSFKVSGKGRGRIGLAKNWKR